MRARNLGNIGVVAAIVLGLVIAVFAGTKLRSATRSLELDETTSQPSLLPTMMPSFSLSPTSQPSVLPSSEPSMSPSLSKSPSSQPSLQPSVSAAPSTQPSVIPSASAMPSESPSFIPSAIPSASPAPSSEFIGTNTTIFLDSRSNSAMVAVVIIIALTYATLYMCGKDNQSKDSCVGFKTFNVFQKGDPQYESDLECDKSELQSKSIPRHESDDTIDTNNVYPLNCTEKEMDMESSNCNGILCSSPMQSNVESLSETDTKIHNIDLEDGRGGTLPNSVVISKKFSSFKSPLRTPKVFKKQKLDKSKDANRRNINRNSSVYTRGNTPWRSISRRKQGRNHSLADDIMMDENDKPPEGCPTSFDAYAKDDLSQDRSKEMDASSPTSEGGIECLAYLKEQEKRKVDVCNLHEARSLRHMETITIKSDVSSTTEWDCDVASLQRPSFDEDNPRGFNDIEVKMESHGIEVSRYESDDID